MNRFKFLYRYDNGILYWRVKPSNPINIGDKVGSDSNGYLRTKLEGKTLQVHRIIYEMFHGEIPEGLTIDHINGNKKDNRIENLQALPLSTNIKRRERGSASLHKATGKWLARRGQESLGYFSTKSGALQSARLTNLEKRL